ncbi:MAG: hypothetical protein Kow00121_63910 [Elainellaceae cyanobacterium]
MAIQFNELLRDNIIGRDSEKNDRFGEALAVGDFDDDGKDDLAVGVTGEAFDGFFSDGFDKGAVQVLYGDSLGFRDGSQEITQNNLASGNSEDGDQFGKALAVGDINGDEIDDLVVGIPFEDGPFGNSGAIQVVFGKKDQGLDRDNTQIVNQDTPGISSQASVSEEFGRSLAVADFNKDGFDDVVIGVPGNRDFTNVRAGGVNIIYGSSTGLNESRRGDQFINRNTPGILGVDREGDRFGEALTVGDFDNDTHLDLAIGAPGANNGSTNNTGTVTILYGSSNGSGLTSRNQQLGQGDSDFPAPDLTEANDEFGKALAAGDFNKDGLTDLAIGVPGEDGGSGAVQIYYGREDNNLPIGEQDGDVELIKANTQFADFGGRFGSALAAEDVDRDGFTDLVVGAPNMGSANTGKVHILYGSTNGFLDSNNQVIEAKPFIQSPAVGLPDSPEAGDFFGKSLAIGNFRGSVPDIAVGSLDNIRDATNAGGVTMIPSSLT